MKSVYSIYNNGLYNNTLYNGGTKTTQLNPDDNIVYNNFGFQNAKYCTQFIRHENSPEKEFILSSVPRNDGMNLQDSFDKKKVMPMTGAVIADSNSDLLDQIANIKKYLHPDNKILKIIEGSQTRVYTASCTNPQNIMSNRDHYNVDWITFDIEFTCWTPYGRDETRTINEIYNKTASSIDIEIDNQGTVKGKLITNITFDLANNVSKINLKNNTNDEEIEITQSFNLGDVLSINSENGTLQVTVNNIAVDFEGSPQTNNTGTNSYTLTITSTSHEVTIGQKFFNYFL